MTMSKGPRCRCKGLKAFASSSIRSTREIFSLEISTRSNHFRVAQQPPSGFVGETVGSTWPPRRAGEEDIVTREPRAVSTCSRTRNDQGLSQELLAYTLF